MPSRPTCCGVFPHGCSGAAAAGASRSLRPELCNRRALAAADGAVANLYSRRNALMGLLAGIDEDPNRLEDTVRAAHQALYDIEIEGGAAGLRPTAPHRD